MRTKFRILLFHTIHQQIVCLHCDPTEVGLLCRLPMLLHSNAAIPDISVKRRENAVYLSSSTLTTLSPLLCKRNCLPPPILLLREWKICFTDASLHYSTMEVIPVNAVCHYSYIGRRLSLINHSAVRKQQEIISSILHNWRNYNKDTLASYVKFSWRCILRPPSYGMWHLVFWCRLPMFQRIIPLHLQSRRGEKSASNRT